MEVTSLSVQDVIKKSVLEAGGFLQGTSTEVLLRAAGYVMLSLVLGLILYFIYKKTYTGVVYSHSFAISLAGMTVLTCGIIVTIQSNVVLSLGMVGALSIVRYRTAIKDPTDLMFLFWAVAGGIATGSGMFYIALLITVVMLVLILILRNRHGKDEMYIMLLHYEGDIEIETEVRKALGTLKYAIKSKTARKKDVEMAIEVRVVNHNTLFADKLRKLDAVNDVTLVQYNGDYID